MNGISVIVCCYNSALRLPMALESLSCQKTGKGLEWEIIIVNNNSTDTTAEIALKFRNLFPGEKRLRIVDEHTPGLNYARKTGVNAACYDIIIFCDDDNFLAENYIQYGYELVQRTMNAGYAVWGGKPVAYFDKDTVVPEWFETEKANYVVGPQGKGSGDISNRGYVWGAGMIISKRVFKLAINEKFPLLLLDRTGNALSSGGDSEISLRAIIAGYKLYYDENLVLQHYISKNKLTPEYNAGLKKGFAQANTVLNKYNIFIHYVLRKNFFFKNYYSFIFWIKYILNKLQLRKLTELDTNALHALFSNKQFHDMDFEMMRKLLLTKTQFKSGGQ